MSKKKLKKKDVAILDEFATKFEKTVDKFDEISVLIYCNPKYRNDFKDAIKLLRKKVKQMKEAETVEELDKVLKIDDILLYEKIKRKEGKKK